MSRIELREAEMLSHFDDAHSVFVWLSRQVGPKMLGVILDELGGKNHYFPTRAGFYKRLSRDLRDEVMKNCYNGDLSELAVRFGVSERTARRALEK